MAIEQTDRTNDVVRLTALGRMAFGAALLVAPGLVGRAWIGADAARPGVRVIARSLGARDIVLGLGTFLALDDRNSLALARWVQLGAFVDAVDAGATLLAVRHLKLRTVVGVLALAVPAAVAGLRLSAHLANAEEAVLDPLVPNATVG